MNSKIITVYIHYREREARIFNCKPMTKAENLAVFAADIFGISGGEFSSFSFMCDDKPISGSECMEKYDKRKLQLIETVEYKRNDTI